MKDKIVIINGLGGCGKSTFVKLCKDYCEAKWENVKAYELSSIDFVKEVAIFCGWDGSKTLKNRTFLHDIKTILEEWDDVPSKKVFEKIYQLTDFHATSVFFVNIREAYNIEKFKDMVQKQIPHYDCITLGVKNLNINTNEVIELITQINEYGYDVVINNNKDLTHLEFLAQNFMQDLIDGKFNKE